MEQGISLYKISYTKMGFAGNLDPDFVIPSAIADVESKSNISVSRTKNEEYNFFIGYQGIQTAKTSQNHRLYYPCKFLLGIVR